MKKILSSILICTMLVCNCVLASAAEVPALTITAEKAAAMAENYVEMPYNEEEVSIIDYWDSVDTLDQVEAQSQLIVKAAVLPGSENYFENNFRGGSTITPIQIHSIYKQDEGLSSLQINDIILIAEPYYIQQEIDGAGYKYMLGGYDASVAGKDYIFFLHYKEEGYSYTPDDTNVFFAPFRTLLGRYPVLDTKARNAQSVRSLTKEALSIDNNIGRDDGYTMTTYKNILAEILKEYN